MRQTKKSLYRSVNTRTHGVRHGRDYTTLFRFVLSRVGQLRADVHSEAVVRIGESSHFNGLYVDENGVLRVVDPGVTAA